MGRVGDDRAAVRDHRGPLRRVDDADRRPALEVVEGRLLEGETQGHLAVRHHLVGHARLGQDLGLPQQGLDELPARVVLPVDGEPGDEEGVRRAGLGRVGVGDLPLPPGVEDVLPRLRRLGVADELLVVHDDVGHDGEGRPHVVRGALARKEGRGLPALVGREQARLAAERLRPHAPQDVAQRAGRFRLHPLDELPGPRHDRRDLDSRMLLLERRHHGVHHVGVRRRVHDDLALGLALGGRPARRPADRGQRQPDHRPPPPSCDVSHARPPCSRRAAWHEESMAPPV